MDPRGFARSLSIWQGLISYKVLALGGDSAAVGLTSASFALLPVVIAGPFLLSAAPSLLLVGVASAVLGVVHLCFTIAGQSAIARFVPLSRMDAAFGWFTAAFSLGQLVGPLVAGLAIGAAGNAPADARLTVLAAILLAITGFFLGLGQPITMTLITQAVPPDARGAALALRLLANRLGQVALPIGAGLLAAPAGPGGALWMSSAVL